MIAALYVARGGVYFGLEGVDPWDEERDARLYAGPHPVVAHPPCGRWGRLARVNYARYGGDHNRPGNDGGCFAAALKAVRTYGGVLEHPAKSYAFAAFGLPRPKRGCWQKTLCGGWVTEVAQCRYGHPAQKLSWLYAVGCELPELDWSVGGYTHQVSRDYTRDNNLPQLSKKQAKATPVPFRDLLLSMAQTAKGVHMSPEVYEALSAAVDGRVRQYPWLAGDQREDVAQTAWEYLLKPNQQGVLRFQTYCPQRGSMRAWAWIIARSAVQTAVLGLTRQFTKDGRLREKASLLAEVSDEDLGEMDPEIREALVEAMKSLPYEAQTLLVLRAEGMAFAKMAEVTGLSSHATARNKFLTAQAMIRKELRARGIGVDP